MPARRRLSFGIKTTQNVYQDVLAVWQEADTIPEIEHAWLWDHMVPLREPYSTPQLEGWSMLAALAAQTRRLRMGLMVTNNQNRLPAILAKIAATVDVISGGRLEFGIGAGAGAEVGRREYEAYGVPSYSQAECIQRLDEACGIIRRMWTEPVFDHEGRHYHLRGAICEPKPVQKPHPPIMIGGGGERLTLRVVARHADTWNLPGPPWSSPEQFRHKSQVLGEHCSAIGRDPAEIERQAYLIVDSREREATRDALAAYVAAGATQLVLADRAPYAPGHLRRLVDEFVSPLILEHSRGGT
jgi:alkanesulfonate monooxygenase SsuD/methylene tetrahydromethanopterin reductase-like flavin-dependent oxidoreductase (luciferase family)